MNKAINNILVPYDFTEVSRKGLETAVQLAKKVDAGVKLLYVIEEPTTTSGIFTQADLELKMKEENEIDHFMAALYKKRSEQFQKLKIQFPDTNLSMNVASCDFSESIEKYSKKANIDLIIIGSTGETSLLEYFKGNHAYRAAMESHKPVITVKEVMKVTENAEMVIVSDLTIDQLKTVSQFKYLSEALDLKSNFLLLDDTVEMGNMDPELFSAFRKVVGKSEYKIINTTNSDWIVEMQKTNQFDRSSIMAITVNEESAWRKLFMERESEKILNEIDKPVLSISLN